MKRAEPKFACIQPLTLLAYLHIHSTSIYFRQKHFLLFSSDCHCRSNPWAGQFQSHLRNTNCSYPERNPETVGWNLNLDERNQSHAFKASTGTLHILTATTNESGLSLTELRWFDLSGNVSAWNIVIRCPGTNFFVLFVHKQTTW